MAATPPVPGWQMGADGNWHPPSSPGFVPASTDSPVSPAPATDSAPSPAAQTARATPTAQFGVINPRAPVEPRPAPAPSPSTVRSPSPPPSSGIPMAPRPAHAVPAPAPAPAQAPIDPSAYPTAVVWSAAPAPIRPAPPGQPTPVSGVPVSASVPPYAPAAPAKAPSSKAADAAAVAGVAADAFFGLVKLVAAVVVVGVLVVGGYAVYKAAIAPVSRADVCSGYDELSDQVRKGNGLFGNPLFNEAKSLGSKASRYDGDADVRSDGEALKKIGDSNSTTPLELTLATSNIASMCGKPPLVFNDTKGRAPR